MSTNNKDFKIKHGLQVADGATFGAPITVGTPTASAHATTKTYVDNITSINGTFIPSNKVLLISTDIGSTVQAYDADLDAIAALLGTSGLLKKTAANTWALDTNTYLTGNQSITVSGDVSGSGTTSISLTLANSGVTASTYKSVTVDAKGRVTAGTNPTTLSGYGITDAASSTHNHTLNSLSNVSITSVAMNDIIGWNGTAWVNVATIDGGSA